LARPWAKVASVRVLRTISYRDNVIRRLDNAELRQ